VHGDDIPALVQLTKTGQIFLLERRTGKALAEVVEKPTPQGAQKGDWTSPTQPYSVGMPDIGANRLSEKDMWGMTPFDQLWCRIKFKSMRYEGQFTPPTTQPTLQYPGGFGGMNWGSAAIDEDKSYLVVNDIRVPHWGQLISREAADLLAKGGYAGLAPQLGTPYGFIGGMFMSPAGIPCQKPPYGAMTAIDLKSQQIMWQIPLGTLEDYGPFGFKTGLPIPIGLPALAGPLATRSGLIFFSGTHDHYLRAIDILTGKELWKSRLPVGSQATPMSFISPQTGRQFVVLTAGGTRLAQERGDYVVAYALPE
jgi:quinate dehydrogenase (quinone)